MALVRRAGPDNEILMLLEESGRNVERAALLLRDLLVDYPERAELARELVLCEHEGDRIAHDIIHRLKGGDGKSAPMDPIDGYQLATALDDIVDFAEQAADNMGLFGVEAPMEQASQMGDVLVGAGEQVARALRTHRPTVPIVLMSGYNEHQVSARFADLALSGYLQKPFTFSLLQQQLRKALARY